MQMRLAQKYKSLFLKHHLDCILYQLWVQNILLTYLTSFSNIYLPISRVKFISQLIISYNLIRHRSSQSMYVVPHITSDGLVQKLSVIGYFEFGQFSYHEKWTVIFGQLYSSYQKKNYQMRLWNDSETRR